MSWTRITNIPKLDIEKKIEQVKREMQKKMDDIDGRTR